MKAVIGIALLTAVSASAMASDQRVDGYMRKDGTYVEPYHRSAPDGNRANNYGSQGNVNPYSGQQGTINPYAPPPVYQPYGQQKQYR